MILIFFYSVFALKDIAIYNSQLENSYSCQRTINFIKIVNIRNFLPKENIVLKPQNIFTQDNPDVVYFNGTTLWAIYVIKQKEFKSPNFLVRRVIYSRLAYIQSMKTLLLVPKEYCGSKNVKYLGQFFDDVIFEEDEKYIQNFQKRIQSNVSKSKYRINNSLKYKSIHSYWLNQRMFDKFKYLPGNFNSWKYSGRNVTLRNPFTKRNEIKKQLFDYDNNLLYTKKVQESFINSYESFLTNVMLIRFNVEQNYISLNENLFSYGCFLNTDMDFFNSQNGLKYINMLCFMGIIPIAVGSENGFKSIVKEYEQEKL